MRRKKEKKREKKEKRGIEDVKGGRKKETGLVKGGMEGRGGGGGGTKSASGARVSNILFLLALAKPRERYRVLHPVFGISPL